MGKTLAKPTTTKALVRAATTKQTAGRARAVSLLALIERRKAAIDEAFYDLGEALRELLRKKLYLSLGHATFEAMLAERGVMGSTQAKKLVAIVDSMPRDKALELGIERAYALGRYTAATPEPDTPAWLLDTGATVAGKPVREATVREIATAAAKARRSAKGGAAKASPEEREAEAAARQLRAFLVARGVEGATVATVRRKGGYQVRVELGVPDVRRLVKR